MLLFDVPMCSRKSVRILEATETELKDKVKGEKNQMEIVLIYFQDSTANMKTEIRFNIFIKATHFMSMIQLDFNDGCLY